MVSIIIPVRNSQGYIGECLSSILAQQDVTVPYEVLISDNGSTDRTREVIQGLLEKFEEASIPVKFFQQEKNLGAYGNLNFLLRNCVYDHAHILCADDYYSRPDSLARIVEVLRKYPGPALFAFDNNTNHTTDIHWRQISEYAGDGVLSADDAAKFLFSFGCFLGGLSNICINRRRIGNGNFFNPEFTYSGDIEFYARAIIAGATVYLSRQEITIRRAHGQSISSGQNSNHRRYYESISTLAMLYDHLRRQGVPAGDMRFFASWQITQYYHAGFKQLLVNRRIEPLKKIISAQRGRPAFYSPAVCMLLSILIWPKLYRTKLHLRNERRFVRNLMQP